MYLTNINSWNFLISRKVMIPRLKKLMTSQNVRRRPSHINCKFQYGSDKPIRTLALWDNITTLWSQLYSRTEDVFKNVEGHNMLAYTFRVIGQFSSTSEWHFTVPERLLTKQMFALHNKLWRYQRARAEKSKIFRFFFFARGGCI